MQVQVLVFQQFQRASDLCFAVPDELVSA